MLPFCRKAFAFCLLAVLSGPLPACNQAADDDDSGLTDDDDSGLTDDDDSGLTDDDDSGLTDDDDSGLTDDDDDDSSVELPDCAAQWVSPLTWFTGSEVGLLAGGLEFGQTHVVEPEDPRLSPPVIAEREAMLLFTPVASLDPGEDLRVAAFEGSTVLGVIQMAAPEDLPQALEQSISTVALDSYSGASWSAALPWHWMREGVVLRIGHPATKGGIHTLEHPLVGLGAPHTFTLSRAKIVLFGEADFDTSTVPAAKLARDFFAATPFAELRWVDSAPWRLDELVVRTAEGPRLVSSETERVAITSDEDRWSILKHQLTLRMSMANTGRGLIRVGSGSGDSSPYSFGTALGLGWVRNGDGTYSDINNSPHAAGWTGWSSLWLGECGNVFVHELGHSMTMLHFGDGTAASWGIDDEYPANGTHVFGHPWGFDSTRREFRTWYQVNGQGPILDDDGLPVGKRDPMNGGEGANALTCFPQYTGYHAWKAQDWAQGEATIAAPGGQAGIYRWDEATASYLHEAAASDRQEPTAVDVPVLTMTGTLSNDDGACQTYPPIRWSAGNLFELPDPSDPNLHSDFVGALWFLEISYGDGSLDRALIAEADMATNVALSLYSLNLDASREPQQVDLYRADAAYPNLDPAEATLIHSRIIEAAADPLPEMVLVGRGQLANSDLSLRALCTPGLDCAARSAESTWRLAAPAMQFQDAAGSGDPAAMCLDEGEVLELEMNALRDGAHVETLRVHIQRIVAGSDGDIAVPMNDISPWFEAPDNEQSLRAWLPYDENAQLPAGSYSSQGGLTILGSLEGEPFSRTGVDAEFIVHPLIQVDLAAEYESPGVTTTDSSIYYLVEDAEMGPRNRIWWGNSDATPLYVPVVNQATGAPAVLLVDAWKKACNSRWNLNSGQAATWGCSASVVLSVASVGNEGLVSGQTYSSPGSSPLVTTAHRWHQPDARLLLDTFAFAITYTVP
jgi:hypothetical protein